MALRHGKIPVERYNGKMTTDEREKAQAGTAFESPFAEITDEDIDSLFSE